MTEKRFLDSSFDQSDSLRNRSTIEFKGLETIEPDKGERQTPGRGGFRLADTPQAWVFIQKKEWLDDTWTYVVSDPLVSVDGQQINLDEVAGELEDKRAELSRIRNFTGPLTRAQQADLERLQAEIEELQQTQARAKAELSERGGQTQFDGKVTQINIRTALGNIITRKLDWMTDHEKFAKKPVLTQTQFEEIQIGKERQGLANNLARIGEEQQSIQNNIQLLENQNEELASVIQSLDQAISEAQAILIESPEDEEAEAALETFVRQRTIANNRQARNQTRIVQLQARQTAIGQIALLSENNSDPIVDADTALVYAPVSLSGNAFTRYYKSPVFRNVDTAEAKALQDELESTLQQLEADTKSLTNRTRTAGRAERLIVKQTEYIETRRRLEDIRTRLDLQKQGAPIQLETGDSVFNGVISLANIPSVQATTTLEGEGSASFTIENPQNIFFISRDDIDLALSEDPFLDSAQAGIDGLVYYRGRFYPEHIVRMIQNRKGSSVDVGRSVGTTRSRAELLREQIIPEIEQQIEDREQAAAASAQAGNFIGANILLQDVAALKADLRTLMEELSGLTTSSLQQAVEEQAVKDRESQREEQVAKERNMKLISQTLLKYYAGKTIFQVLDRVYIWMTSPTRTLHRLNRTGDDRFAVEDPSAIGIMQQLAAVQSRVDAIVEEIQRARNFINDHTPADLVGPRLPEEERTLPADPNVLFQVTEGFSRFAGSKTTLLGPDVVQYLNELLEEQKQREGVLSFLEKQVKSTDSATAANTFNKIPTAPENGILTQEQRQAIGEYDSRFLGYEEDRVQVFQGVISTVKQTYSNGKYQIQVSCKDNMVFLNMSRIMIKPALRNGSLTPQGILQDPIWRNNELAGNWKNGILVLDFALVDDEVGAKLDKKIGIDADLQQNFDNRKVASISEARRAVSPFTTTLPFARVDAANLVSFIVTGFPYNFEQFVKNASFGGRLFLERKSGTTDQRSEDTSFFSFLKRQIGEVNDRLGDFEPFIDITTLTKTLNELEGKKQDLEEKEAEAARQLKNAYEAYLLNRIEKYLRRVSIDRARNSVLNTSRIGVVEEQLALEGAGRALNRFKEAAEAAANQLRGGQEGFLRVTEDAPTLLSAFSNVLVGSAGKNEISDKGAARTATVGQTAGGEEGVETQIKELVESLKASAQAGAVGATGGTQALVRRGLGPFQLIATLITEIAASVKKASTTGGKRQGIDPSGNASTDSVSKAVNDALTAFVKELLTVQPDFAQEYRELSIASTNLKEFNALRPTLEKLLGDINAENKAIARSFQEGPQSTIEKIVRVEKKNFLIISDRYTLDDSIQAYHTEIAESSPAVWQAEFETALSVCRRAADQVDFEFYADEDGNLQFKPPTYNRILREHFDLISETDSVVRDAVLVRYGGNDGVVFRAVLKGVALLNMVKTEFSSKRLLAKQDLQNATAEAKKTKTVTENQKNSPSNSASEGPVMLSGSLNNEALTKKAEEQIGGSAPEIRDRRRIFSLLDGSGNADLGKIVSIVVSVDAEEQAREASRLLHVQEDKALLHIDLDKQLRLDEIKPLEDALALVKQGQEPDTEVILRLLEEDVSATAGVEQIVTVARQTLNRRRAEIRATTANQKIALYDRLLTKIDDLLSQAQTARETARKKATTFVNSLPTFTDEKRIHRLADHDVISYDVTEAPPRFTHLEIVGSPDIQRINIGDSQKPEFYWAGGVDYDNWRQYGFMSESMQKAYFHSGPAARTYLRAMLGRERGRVLSASAQVRGDSKFRVGDCVFLESVGMYFYVTSVSHSLSYGQSFTTNLTLAYGRRIGELIPHPFDTLGKIMIEAYQDDVELLLAREQFLDIEKAKQLRS